MHDFPDDVLCHIFLMTLAPECQPDYRYVPHFVTKQDLRERLVSICLTCKHWYELAYNYPLLWAGVIDFEIDSPAYIAELLRRSGSVPLEIGRDSASNSIGEWKDRKSAGVLQTIFQHKSRIKTMNLNILKGFEAFICENFLNHPAPNLEYLNLIIVAFPARWIPGPLFGNCAPRLRRFKVQRFNTDFYSPILHNLTSLSVSSIVPHHPTSASDAPTASDWLDILQHIPSLEILTLVDAITQSDNSEATEHTSVPLTSLRLLSLFGFLQESVVILKYLEIPSSCGIRLHCDVRHSFSLGHVILGTLVRQLSQIPDLPNNKQYLQTKLLSDHHIYFSNSRHIGRIWDLTEIDELARHAEESSAPLVWVILTFADDVARQFFRQLLSMYEPTFSNTTEFVFWFEGLAFVTESDITFVSTVTNFDAFTAVTTLELYSQSVDILLPHFTHSANSAFPSLQTLVLIGTRFNNEINDVVLQFLLFRAGGNVPISRLVLMNTTIDDEQLSILREEGKIEVIRESKPLAEMYR